MPKPTLIDTVVQKRNATLISLLSATLKMYVKVRNATVVSIDKI